ncbi:MULTISPECIES: CRISPR-associated endonuclease Cas2 [Gordonibacter]|jgi:CRISPR-associated protein Cas2|uniref:CRISPR-associated endoribonuclease Cas2 n=1 Tax=Gordonibacter urolithinfaciens TaxID=1335613 RepID=A0A423UL88_9ACTN|nr:MULTISPECIES: CRISPR-associated endonuclease Cas2 [Gordonibacter]MBS6976479.1 CRISPR-associated endonuclease Cas2 [Eggerthellaceae bacterium]MCB6561800.1 CRISPR-associated endonuclease Cas2 [Gordonibacter urolithinfaciens]MCB7085858.1 CRISPR-associated endonuclease Cas2 [Gordonibacter urolithinfaciens]MDN4470288.1 CRISPR-associated endonuclease Cas2 [Gordonibacter sp. RACS_AR68]MSA93754.1 CRISPR-associated endonuclease Cas2 [Gordonibacter urolithinfaciens]
MYVLVTYDVETASPQGTCRLRRVAKICVKYGQRVQNSVFECSLDPAQFETMKSELMKAADLTRDSLRFYNLGKNWKRKVEHVGAKEAYDPEGFLCV